jgi:hypothetical protein
MDLASAGSVVFALALIAAFGWASRMLRGH